MTVKVSKSIPSAVAYEVRAGDETSGEIRVTSVYPGIEHGNNDTFALSYCVSGRNV